MKLRGFKTYENEEKVVFSEFTCIVGPNGAGKSNLIDALMFVLGCDLSEIRGHVRGRESRHEPMVEISQRNSNGSLDVLRREMKNETSYYYINNERTSYKDYTAYLEKEHISTKYKNFLIAQNEAMVRSPKDLTRFIEEISGSGALKEKYKEVLGHKESTQKKYHDLNERRKVAEVEVKEQEEVEEMGRRQRALEERRRELLCKKIGNRKRAIAQTQEETRAAIESLKSRYGGVPEDGEMEVEKQMAVLQTELIKVRAETRVLESVRNRAGNTKEAEIDTLEKEKEEIRAGYSLAKERRSEAEAQVEECRWQRKQVEEVVKEKNRWTEKFEKDAVIKTVEKILGLEEEKLLAEIRKTVEKTERQIKEAEQERGEEDGEEEEAESENERLKVLNRELQEVLRVISQYSSKRRDVESASKLRYYVSQLRKTMPQIIGRVEDLFLVREQRYAGALRALLHAHRNTVVVETEQDVFPILSGLAQARVGRITVLPLTRIEGEVHKQRDAPEGYVRFSDLVEISSEVRNRDRLSGYVCKDALVYLGKGMPGEVGARVVTLDGVSISREGAIRKVPGDADTRGVKELEEKRDRILEEIRRESAEAKRVHREKENIEKRLGGGRRTPKLQELERRYRAEKEELEEAKNALVEKTALIIKNSGVEPFLVEQAMAQGVCDSTTGEKKLKRIEAKERGWEVALEKARAQVAKLEAELERQSREIEEAEKVLQAEKSASEARLRLLREKTAGIEKSLLYFSEKSYGSEKLQMKILKEKIASLGDELEEIEQYAVEEGLYVSGQEDAHNLGHLDSEIEKVEKEIAESVQYMKGKKTGGCTKEEHARLAQEADKSKAELSEISKQLHETKKERRSMFLEVFDRINTDFNKHYTNLTGSTQEHVRAHLGLESPGEPYLGGTQVFVMPSGKTFREAKYLSGGEKTIATLALLLAVHELFPAPFYIFDELDAALDRDKIASLRASLQNIRAQFIAVTHRLELFGTADTLMGVAKPPKKSSQVLSIRL